jgi:hypothetical protein
MTRTLRISVLCAVLALCAVSSFAQNSPLVGTVIDVDEGSGRLQIEADNDSKSRITIETDSVSTTYHGFGTVIADKPEIFTGSSGLSNIRLGDRISIYGSQRAEGIVKADRVSLLGRTVVAGTSGVGSTRDPATSATTPTDDRASAQTAQYAGTVEGTIRQINIEDGRIVVQTNQRRMLTVRTYRSTPVAYRGETYRTTNLEIGDVIRVETDSRATGDEVTARRIEVTRSVQEGGTAPPTGGLVTTLSGRVTRVEPSLDYVYIDAANRTNVRIDMGQAEDARGDAIRASDVRVGDRVDVSGSYNRAGDLFLASTLRFGAADPDEPPVEDYVQYGLVTITGTVTETLEDASTLSVRDRDSNRVLRIWIANDFVVRTKGNTYTTAEQLRVNDTVVLEAFRDDTGNLIAQTVRLRNR